MEGVKLFSSMDSRDLEAEINDYLHDVAGGSKKIISIQYAVAATTVNESALPLYTALVHYTQPNL